MHFLGLDEREGEVEAVLAETYVLEFDPLLDITVLELVGLPVDHLGLVLLFVEGDPRGRNVEGGTGTAEYLAAESAVVFASEEVKVTVTVVAFVAVLVFRPVLPFHQDLQSFLFESSRLHLIIINRLFK